MAQSFVQVDLPVQIHLHEVPIRSDLLIGQIYLKITLWISCCEINATACQPVSKIKVKTNFQQIQYQIIVISLQFSF